MLLSSPTGPTVSVHRSTSFLRGCNPIEESKQELASLRGVYCASMGEPLRDQDWRSRQPRTYSDTSSFYASNQSNPDSTSSMPVMSGSPGREQKSDIKREESSPPLRKRKHSWSRNEPEGNKESREEKNEALMKPMSSFTAPKNERLPGIAHLDEQMHTPWSVGHARRTAGLRDSSGEDSLRRLSLQSFPHGDRTWRSSLPNSISPGSRSELPPPIPSHSYRRASSPGQAEYERQNHLQSTYYSHYTERRSRSPGGSTRSPSDHDPIASYRQRSNEEPPRLPSREGRRHQAAFGPADSRDEQYSYSQDRRLENVSEHPPYRYSMQPHHRDADTTHSQSSYSHHGSNEQSYNHRMFDRDSPSYFDETNTGGQQRLESYPPNTSPSVPRRRGKLPKIVTDLLKAWLLDHSSHPYPTEDEKRRLCSVTGLSISQVSNWFINARRRILVPQGSGNFALGQPSTTSGQPPSPPQHRLAPSHHHHAPPSHHHQQQYHASPYQEEGKHHMYRPVTGPSRSKSRSPDNLPSHSR